MVPIRFLLGIVCLIIFRSAIEPQCSTLTSKEEKNTRQKLIEIAQSQIGIKEATGNNDGKQVETYLALMSLKKGAPYCAAFISWDYATAGCKQPRTAWSPDLFPLYRQVSNPQPADIYGIYSLELKRIAHCGLIESVKKDWVIGIEANTNLSGSRNGDGVYKKRRHRNTIKAFACWLPKTKIGGSYE